MRHIFSLLLIALLFGSCSSPVPQPLKPSPVLKTELATLSPSPDLTATDEAYFSSTLMALKTQVAGVRVNRTTQTAPIKSKTALPSRTPDLIFQRMVQDGARDVHRSPDGKWVAESFEVAASKPGIKKYLLVYHTDGQKERTLSTTSQDLPGFTQGSVQFYPIHWSMDGHYLYLSARVLYADGPVYFNNGFLLRRLNLDNGVVSEVLAGKDLNDMYNFAFSPDGSTLVFIQQFLPPLTLHFVNLNTGKQKSILLKDKYDQAGDVVWSPSGNQVVLKACAGPECLTKSLLLVNFGNNSISEFVPDLSTINKELKIEFPQVEWTTDDMIRLLHGKDTWDLNIVTMEVTKRKP